VPGYLVVPPGKGPFPAVLYLHGSGGDRLELLGPATWMTARGAVALTVDDPFARDPQLRVGTGVAAIQKFHDIYVLELRDLRRAVDLLQSLPTSTGDASRSSASAAVPGWARSSRAASRGFARST
jgi:dienelactone hydrolase